MEHTRDSISSPANRRSFIKKGLTAAGAVGLGSGLLTTGLLTNGSSLYAEDDDRGGGRLFAFESGLWDLLTYLLRLWIQHGKYRIRTG